MLKRLENGTTLSCDTSALIVLAKLDLLTLFADYASLKIHPLVAEEFGEELPIRGDFVAASEAGKTGGVEQNAERQKETTRLLAALSPTDREVVATALADKGGVLADDKRILRTAEELDLIVLDSLSAALALLFRGIIDERRYQACEEILATHYRYEPRLLRRAHVLRTFHEKMA